MGYGGAKTVAADAIVQRYVEQNEVFDPRRAGVFLLFGVVQVGFVQYMLYVKDTTHTNKTSPCITRMRA